jgi:Bacterial PH domain
MPEQTRDEPKRRLEPRRLVLRDGESVVVVLRPSRWLSLPKYLVTLGFYGFWRKRHTYILTNQRMLLGKGIFVRTERSVPISQIEDAAFVRRGAGSYSEVTVRAHRRMRTEMVGPLSPRSARRLTTEIQART